MLLAGLEEATRTRYLSQAREYLCWYKEEKGKLDSYLFSVESLLFYMSDLYEAGCSSDGVRKMLAGLEVISILFGVYVRHSKDPILSLALSRWDRAGKKRKVHRHYISRQQLQVIIQQPPVGVDKTCWEIFCCVSWVFLLRHSEMRAVQPKHLQFLPRYGKQGPAFSCFVVNPKTAKGQNQTVYLPLDTVPSFAIKVIRAFIASESVWNWNSVVPRSVVNDSLRSSLVMVRPFSLCHHSFRHGRACDLYHECGYKILSDLMEKGRWRSKGAVQVYVHSKLNNEEE